MVTHREYGQVLLPDIFIHGDISFVNIEWVPGSVIHFHKVKRLRIVKTISLQLYLRESVQNLLET